MTARLIVRRVKKLNEQADRGPGRTVRHLPLPRRSSPTTHTRCSKLRNSIVIMPAAEQLDADLIDGPLAHLPCGPFAANAAWVTCAAITHNLLRAPGAWPAFHARARGATLRRDLISVPARLARHGRGHLTLYLPESWHRAHEWASLFHAATGPPAAAA